MEIPFIDDLLKNYSIIKINIKKFKIKSQSFINQNKKTD
jgi:hypothetical protein